MARLPVRERGTAEFIGIMSHRPELMEKWLELDSTILFTGVLSPRLKYKVQMAMASHEECAFCTSMLTPPGEYDRQESLAVAFAELFQADHTSITQGHFEALAEEFTTEQIVELCLFIWLREGGLRMARVWDLGPGTEEERNEYAKVVAEAQTRWEAGRSGATSLWKRQVESGSESAAAAI